MPVANNKVELALPSDITYRKFANDSFTMLQLILKRKFPWEIYKQSHYIDFSKNIQQSGRASILANMGYCACAHKSKRAIYGYEKRAINTLVYNDFYRILLQSLLFGLLLLNL